MCKKSEGALTTQTLEHVQLIMIFLKIKAHVIQKHPKSSELIYTNGTETSYHRLLPQEEPQRGMAAEEGTGRVHVRVDFQASESAVGKAR